jgi:hypothetical protein
MPAKTHPPTITTRQRRKPPATAHASQPASGALFPPGEFASRGREGVLETVPLDQLTAVRNPRKQISEDGIIRLATMLMRNGQLIPAIGRRIDNANVALYAGQRRKLSAEMSHTLAGSDGYEGLKPVSGLIVLMLDYEPSEADIRRIQAQENAHEPLSIVDQQAQFFDVWTDRAGLAEDERIAMVCFDLGISPVLAHNLRRQLSLPEEIRSRVAERPRDGELSITMANRLAEMREHAPEIATAVAERITTRELHDRAIGDMGAFVHRTVLESEQLYALRIDAGAVLVADQELDRARQHLDSKAREVVRQTLKCERNKLDGKLRALVKAARDAGLTFTVDQQLRDRARNGNFALAHDRGRDFAATIWIVDPAFTISVIHEQIEAISKTDGPAREAPAYFKTSGSDAQTKKARKEDHERRRKQRDRAERASRRNITLGEDLAANLIDPKPEQLEALRALVCHLLVERFGDVIAYGAGWTSSTRQQPVGDTNRYEPQPVNTIISAELERALTDSDPLRGIAQLVTRLACAFLLDPEGVTQTKALGQQRMARPLREALPGGDHPARRALWELMRPVLSPALIDRHREAFVSDPVAATVDLDAHRRDSDLAAIDLGEERLAA